MSKVNEMGDSSKIDQKVVMGGFRGNLYQVKLLTLFFYRGLSSNYEYELGTEIDEAEKFDDLVFKYKNETDENEHYILVQAKHKMEKTDKIKITDLLTVGDVNFGLVKYYNSYRKAKNNDLFKMGIIEYVIVYTNNEFDTKTKEILEDDIEEVDLKKENMLCLCKIDEKGKFYKFKPKLLLEKLKPLIKKYLCDYYRIAERLVDFLLKKKTFLHSDDLFKNYHCLLADEVIDVSKKVFREEFINGQKTDSDELKHFRKVLIEVLKANGKDLESINKEFQFVFSNKFGKANDQIQLWPKEKIEITDKDIEEFSNKFVFLTEQPNGDNLDKMMENELRDKYFFDDHMYNTLIKEMTDWTAGKPFDNSSSIKDERFISSKDAREFLTKINRKQNEVISKITTDEYIKIIKKFNMLFDDRAMKESLGKFLDSESMILNIFSEYVKLTSIKVYQTLKFIFEERRTDIRIENFILLRLSMLFDSSIGHYAIRSFESKLFDHSLLIIECENDISDIGENHKSFQEKIHFISQNSCNKKIVFISSENNSFSKEIRMKLNEKIRFEEKSDQINFVEDLSNDSKQFVLEKCSILFQGYEIKLNHIISENSVSLIDGEVLTKIINEEKIQLGKKNKGLEKVKDYYNSRKLVFELKVHDNIILLITGFDEIDFTTLSNNRFFEKYSVNLNISDQVNVFESDKSVYYDQICTKIENQVCLLKKHNDKIQLLQKNNKFALKSNEIKKEIEKTFESEIILLTGVPGMGKTCVFANWCEQIKENYPFLWVCKIDLINMSKTLERISKNDDSDIDNLTNFLTIALDLKTSFETKILKKYLEDGKFVLFLDGLDEVSIYEKEVKKLIRKLNEISKENKIFLSSRPLETLLRNIKNEFNVASCKLQPFERFDQSEFLKKFWKVNMESFSENSFENFIETLLKNLKKKINDSGIEFSSIALHLYMIAVTFKKRFENFNTSKFDEMYYHQNQYTDDISKISELYKSFIRTKCYEIFYDDKLKIERSVKGIKNMAECYFNSFIEKNKLLALNSMFSDEQIDLLLDRKSLGELEKYKIEIENSGEDIGIVVHIVDKKPFYVHKTFAEYFIADFFISLFNDENISEKSPAVNFFFKNILDESNSTLCYFFDDMLNSEINGKIEKFGIVNIVKDLDVKILFDAISYEWQHIVKLLVNNDIDMTNTNQSKDSVLHSAIFKCHDVLGNDENENEILNTILEKLKEKPETLKKLLEAEDFMGYTPMFNVVQYANLKIVEKLFEIIFDFKILNLNNVQGMFCSNLLHTAAQNPNKDVFQFVLSKINTNTDSLLLQNYFLETDRSKNTPLITAIECGQINTAKTLIEQYKSSNTLLNVIAIKNDLNDNILHIAARRLGENFIQIIVEELKKYPETLKKLLRDKNLDGDAPFFLSIEYGAFDDLKFFVDTFESLNIAESAFFTTNDENENMLHLAARKENDCLEFLLEHLDNYPEVFKYLFKKESEYEVNPLFDAASMDNIKNMKLLIKKIHELKIFETAVSVQNSNKYNILHLIVRKDNDILKYFLEEIKMYPDILKKLLQQRNKDGSTPLFLAVRFDCINNVKTIIESFYDMNMLKDALNSEDLNNNNVLHLAVLKKNKDCLPFVLEKLKEYPDILKKFILNDNLEGLTPLFVAVYFDNLNSVECLVKICKDLGVLEKAVDFQNSDYCTVLHLAAKNKSDDCFRFLLEEIIDFRDTLKKILETKKDGLTPIFLIVQNGHISVMNGLIEAFRKLDILKSAISAVNDDEENIMHLSAKMESDDFLQLIIEELKNDKDVLETLVQMPNKKGETPLVLAERQNYVIDLS